MQRDGFYSSGIRTKGRRGGLAGAGTLLVDRRTPPPEMTAPKTDEAEISRLNDLMLRVARQRDRQAFVALFRHFAPRLKSFLLRAGMEAGAAEETIQDVMVTVWHRAESFDPTLAAAGTWIFTIARNRRIDRLRRDRRPAIDPADPALVPDAADGAMETMLVEERAAELHRAIRELPPEQAELLRMAYFEDKAHSAIAAERHLPLGTVKSRLRLALARLRKIMGSTGLEGETA
jgi:RNA polymerase sigma-70 factor (ECF subfamily)